VTESATMAGCPLCGGHKERVLFEEASAVLRMRIVRCSDCGFMFQNPRVSELMLEDAHAEFTEYERYPALQEAKQRLYGPRIRRILESFFPPRPGRFLDFGAGYGAMLHAFRHARPDWEIVGVEPSARAGLALSGQGFEIRTSIDELATGGGALFDWINLDNVLEHLDDPVGSLSSLRKLLARDGIVFIEVPNESFFRLRYRLNDWVRGSAKAPTFPGHLNLFTPRTLRRTAGLAGFKVTELHGVSAAEPGRMEALFGIEPAGRLLAILRLLRWTRLDHLVGMTYFTQCILQPLEGPSPVLHPDKK